MRLAIASPSASTYSETFIRMQMENLPCVLRIHGRPVASESIPGGAIRPVDSLKGLLSLVRTMRAGKKWREALQSEEIIRRLRLNRIDRVLANFGPAGAALLPACRRLSLPLVVHFHGFDAHRTEVANRCREQYAVLGREAAAVIAVSQGMMKALAALGIPENKLHLMRCSVDPAQFEEKSILPAAPVFFGVGRFVDKKAPYLTLLAFAKARQHLPNARLILGGTGELLEATRNIASALHLNEAVEFPGVLTPDAVAGHMRHATAFVQHSLEPAFGLSAGDREGTPVTVLEAMMTGLAVISTRHAGIGEVIEHNRTGLLVDERDVDGMANAMVLLGTSPQLAVSLGQAARAEALAKYTAAHYLGALRKVLENV